MTRLERKSQTNLWDFFFLHLNDKGLTGKNKPWRAERKRLTCWYIRAKSCIKIQPTVLCVTWQKGLIDSLEKEGILGVFKRLLCWSPVGCCWPVSISYLYFPGKNQIVWIFNLKHMKAQMKYGNLIIYIYIVIKHYHKT